MNSQPGLEAILAMVSGSDLSSLACRNSKVSERNEDPCERDFLKSIYQ